MNEATIALTVMSLLILFIFLGFLVWGFRSGQFRDIEKAKYQLFDEEKQKCDKEDITSKESRSKKVGGSRC